MNDNQMEVLVNEIFDWYFKTHPLMATRLGRHEYDHRLPDYSPAGIAGRLKGATIYRRRLEQLDAQGLNLEQRVDLKVLWMEMNKIVRQHQRIRLYTKNPGALSSSIMGIAYLMLVRDYAPLSSRLENLTCRLQGAPGLLKEQRRLIDNPPPIYTRLAITQTAAGLNYFKALKPMIRERMGGPREDFERALKETVAAFEEHLKWLQELSSKSGGDFAVGEQIFNQLLTEDYLLDYDADSLLEKGWSLFNESREQLHALSHEINPKLKPSQLLKELRAEHPPAEELLSCYRSYMERARDFIQKEDLVDLPPGERLLVEETPTFFRAILPFAAYMSPAPFEKEALGRFWVTPAEDDEGLGAHSIYKLPVTTVHEAYPGHHLQLCTAQRVSSKARLLSYCPLFSEGWAFYCEELMEEKGFLQEPEIRLMRLKDQLWRAARIILDVALHTHRISVPQAVSFLVERVGLGRTQAAAEVGRYTLTPTQPMSYLIGKLEILKLARDYRLHQGEDFQLKTFHQRLLSCGTIPPALARELLFSAADQE